MAGIYIHIPFCRQACTYCNFHFSTSLKLKEQVLAAIVKELEMQRDYLQGSRIETIYLGGGTPSMLSSDEINRLFDHIFKLYPVDNLKECTLEANPDDLSTAYIKSLRTTPVNRFSIGVQSFREQDLLYMHRAHNASQADYAIKAAQDAGFTTLSIDLIYGTPGLSDEAWKENLLKVAEYRIPHFSAYALTVEENTALSHAIKTKKTQPVDAEQSAAQFELLMEQSAVMGYEHYEISNLALPGHQAVHNTNYWKGIPYLGIGPAAHSFNGRTRRWNVANNALYAKNILINNKPVFEEEELTSIQHLNEYIMTSLRTQYGCDLSHIEAEWDSTLAKKVIAYSNPYLENNCLILADNKLMLTNKGRLIADRIAGDLFIEAE